MSITTSINADTSGISTTSLSADDATSITLPDGFDISSLTMARDGANLVLTTPDGQTCVLEGYFSAATPPIIMGTNGTALTQSLVSSFLSHGDAPLFATNETATDASPVGEVSETNGHATVTHANGKTQTITIGTQIFEGDIIETDAEGAVNITFADDSTFAISQNARMSVDDFSFNSADQSGSTGLSILRGVFMFTSGLIGREDPDSVSIDTPVGSIGIRGTIIGGTISDGIGQITVLEGAIVVRNGTGERILTQQYDTVTLNGYDAPITGIGTLDAGTVANTYGAVRSVSPNLFSAIDDAAGTTQSADTPATEPPADDAPADDAPTADAPASDAADDAPQAAPPAAAETPATDDTTPPAPTPQAAADDDNPPPVSEDPIFQTLGTGSNLQTDGTEIRPADTNEPPAASNDQTAPPANNESAPPIAGDSDEQVDMRPPSSPTFSVGGSVDEDSPAGTIVGTVSSSANSSFNVRYELLTNPDNLFTINASTGVVSLIGTAADADTTSITGYDLSVRATRLDNPALTSESTLTVTLNAVDEAPEFGNTTAINVDEGAYTILTAAAINAVDPEGAAISFILSNTTDGTIQTYDGSTWTTLATGDSFSATQLANGNVRYLHNGAENATATLTLQAIDTTANASEAKAFTINVTPLNDAPTAHTNTSITIAENASAILSNTDLSYTDPDNTTAELTYTLTGTTHGTLSYYDGSSWSALAVTDTFTQADIDAGKIKFTQDGDESNQASFSYSVTDAAATPQSGTYTLDITPVNDTPTLNANPAANISEGGNLVFSSSVLHYSDPDNTTDELTYTLDTTTHGQLEYYDGLSWNALSAGDTFTQADINSGDIRFTHNGDEITSATISYTLSDGTASIGTQTLTLNVTGVDDSPTQTNNNAITLDEAATEVITTAALSWSDADNSADELTYTVSAITNGTLEYYNGTAWSALAIADTFTQADIDAGNIQFTHDGSETTSASFNYDITDGVSGTQSDTFAFNINPVNDAPIYTNNTTSTVTEGSDLVLSSSILHYSDADNTADELTYTLTGTTNGTLSYDNGSTSTALGTGDTFTQSDINLGYITFTHDGSEASTADISYTLSDGALTTTTQTLSINVNNVDDTPTSAALATTALTITETNNSVGGTTLSALSFIDVDTDLSTYATSSFVIESYQNSSWVADGRFELVYDSGSWQLKTSTGHVLSYESEPTIDLRVRITNGASTTYSTSNTLTLTLTDINEAATAFTLNGGVQFNSAYTALITGDPDNNIIARINISDEDTIAGNRPTASEYSITMVSAGGTGLTAADFTITDTLDQYGNTHQVLVLNPNVSATYTGQAVTVSITLDAAQDGIGGADDITNTYTFIAQSNIMVANTTTTAASTRIINDARHDGAAFGSSVAVGDLDGDGVADLVFGAPNAANGETNAEAAGGVYTFLTNSAFTTDAAADGRVELSTTIAAGSNYFAELATAADDTGALYGSSVAIASDFNTDGDSVVAVADGTNQNIDLYYLNGSTAQITGIDTGNPSTINTARSLQVTSIGDVNMDGQDDLLITTPYADSGLINTGAAYIIYGADSVSGTNITLNHSSTASGLYGTTASALDDFNGDGIADFAIGAPGETSSKGLVSVIFGAYDATSTTFASNSFTLTGVSNESSADNLGNHIASGGDFNGDGKTELLASVTDYDTSVTTIYAVFGADNLSNTSIAIDSLGVNGFTITSSDPTISISSDLFGSAGDFNGDGYDDIFVGITQTNGLNSYDSMLILYGNATANSYDVASLLSDTSSTAYYQIRLLNEAPDDTVVTAAGDLDGDGYDDIIITNPDYSYNASGTSDGMAQIIYGADTNNSNADTLAASTDDDSLVGTSGDDIAYDANNSNISFNGGAGDDAFVIHSVAGLRNYDGGTGHDTLKLFFSATGSESDADTIDLQGLRNLASNIEEITFGAGSLNDTLKLDIRDVLSLADSSENNSLIISSTASGTNYLEIYNDGAQVTALNFLTDGLTFTNDADNNTTADTTTINSQTYYVYTNLANGAELIVDARISGADNFNGV